MIVTRLHMVVGLVMPRRRRGEAQVQVSGSPLRAMRAPMLQLRPSPMLTMLTVVMMLTWSPVAVREEDADVCPHLPSLSGSGPSIIRTFARPHGRACCSCVSNVPEVMKTLFLRQTISVK